MSRLDDGEHAQACGEPGGRTGRGQVIPGTGGAGGEQARACIPGVARSLVGEQVVTRSYLVQAVLAASKLEPIYLWWRAVSSQCK